MRFNRILFPVDFSAHSEACLEMSWRLLAEDHAGEIHFLYVLHSPTDFSSWEGDPKAEVQQRLEEFVHDLGPPGQPAVTLAVSTGHPSTEIGKYAAANDCDLIVMATHGRTGLAHMILGSTAEQVVRHAPCPVLTVRVQPRVTGKGPVEVL
jgi:universal stress protein A